MRMRTGRFLAFLILWSVLNIDASEHPCEVIRGNKAHNRIKLAFFAEGYTEAERSKYETDVENMVCTLFTISPFKEYREMFNVFRVWTPSKKSGISSEESDSTFFNGTVNNNLLSISEKAFNSLDTLFNDSAMFGGMYGLETPQDLPVIIFNHNKRAGGAVGAMLVFCNRYEAHTLAHELGHMLGRLKDEYDATYVENVNEGLNVTKKTDPDSIPWRRWLTNNIPLPTPETEEYSEVIGLFEGANYHQTGWYRPKLRCKMNNCGSVPFCEVCKEALSCQIIQRYDFKGKLFHMQVFDSIYPAPESNVNEGFIKVVMNSDSSPFKSTWLFNGVKIENDGYSLDLSTLHERGTIQFIVKDTMGFIRDTAFLKNYSSDTVRWYYNPTAANIANNSEAICNKSDKFSYRTSLSLFPAFKTRTIYTLDGRKIILNNNKLEVAGTINGYRKITATSVYIAKSEK